MKNEKQWKVIYALVDVVADDYEEGEKGNTHSYKLESLERKNTFSSIQEIIKVVNKDFDSDLTIKDFSAIDDRIGTNLLVDEDNFTLSSNDPRFEAWKEGKFTLYSANIDIKLSVIEGERPANSEDFEEEGIEDIN